MFVFDDSFEHEVWHNGTSMRLVLIVDIWHPELTERERRSLPAIQKYLYFVCIDFIIQTQKQKCYNFQLLNSFKSMVWLTSTPTNIYSCVAFCC